MNKDIYSKLNPEQKLAVDTIDGPLLVLAGPGTGKTQLLSARTMRILELTDTPASAILCLTFTDNGAENMCERLTQFIGDEAYQVAINTYHGFAQTIISQYPDFFVEKKLKTIIDPITEFQFIEQIKEQFAPNNILKNIENKDILATIHELKSALLTAEDLRKVARLNQAELARINPIIHNLTKHIKRFSLKLPVALDLFEQILEVLTPNTTGLSDIKSISFHAYHQLQDALDQAKITQSTKPLTNWRSSFLPKDKDGRYGLTDNYNFYRLMHLADLFEQYQHLMHTNGLYDFSDMIIETIKTIEKNDDLRFNLQEKYLYIMLDEYQDTNRAQSKLIELLVDSPIHEGRPNIMAVGDDDQAIFAFQGADYSNMLNFYQRYRDTKLINLSKNYRSSQPILDFASNIAQKITDRLTNLIDQQSLEKTLIAANSKLPQPSIQRLDFDSKVAQNQWLVETIDQLIKHGENPDDIAVISAKHRTLEATTPFFLTRQIPIHYERSQNVLDNIGIQALLKIAELVQALRHNRPSNHLIFEVLSYDIWELDTIDIWKLSWQNPQNQNFLETILKNPDDFSAKLRPIALWLLEFAKKTDQLSLEGNFDVLLGNTGLDITDNNELRQFFSPLKQFYQRQSDEAMFEFSLCLNLLRDRFITFAEAHPDSSLTPVELLLLMAQQHQNTKQPILLTNPYQDSQHSVKLMTAFKAKGLEFKHVFLLDVNQSEWGGSNSGRNKLALPDNLRFIRHEKTTNNDQLRLLFVAISRAKTNLYLLSPTVNNKQKPIKRLEFLNEISTDDAIIAETIPAPYKQVQNINFTVTTGQINLELFDNFTDWRNRHFQASLKYPQLLETRIKNFKLSPTSFNNFLNLEYGGPLEFFLSQILRFPSAFDLRTTYGTIIHAVLDHAQKSAEFEINQIMDFFRQRLAETRLSNTDRQTLLNWGEGSLPIFLEQRRELFNPEHKVETEVRIGTPPAIFDGILLGGAVDRVEFDEQNKSITLVDYKTGKSRDKISSQDGSLYGYITQLYFYKIMLGASAKYPNYNITSWRLEFLSPTPDGQVKYLAANFDPKEEKRIRQLIKAVWQRIQACDFSEADLPKDLAGRKQFEQALLDTLAENSL